MAGVTLHPDSQQFPPGTTLKVYARAQPEPGGPVLGAPAGAVLSEPVVSAAGRLVVTGLTEGLGYIAWAATPDRYLRFEAGGTQGGVVFAGADGLVGDAGGTPLSGSVVTDSSRIDMCRTWGCKPGIDNTAKIAEALAQAVEEGKNEIDLYFSELADFPIEGAVKEGEAFNTKYAGQILLPARSSSQGRLTIKISGPTPPPQPWFFSSDEPSSKAAGVVLKSNAVSGFVFDVIPGLEVVTPTIKGFSNLLVVFENVVVQIPDNPQCGGINAGNALSWLGRNASVEVATENEGTNTFPTGTNPGLILPHTGNVGYVRCESVFVCGCPVGVGIYEHAVLDGLYIKRCAVGIDALGQGHINRFVYVDIERCPTGLRAKNEGECGGNIEGLLDFENAEAGQWATKYIIDEEYSGRLRGRLAVFPFSKDTRGYPARVAPAALNLCNPYYGSTGHRENYPLDECTRIANIANNLGTCDISGHPWFIAGGKFTTENGALLSEEAGGISRAITTYLRRFGGGSRVVSATIATRASGTYNLGVLLNEVKSGAHAGNFLFVTLEGGKVKLKKEVAGVRSTLGEGGAVETGKTYEVAVRVIHAAYGGPPTEVVVFVGTTEVLSYKLLAADKEALEDTQKLEFRDGIRIAEDVVSKITRFQVAPE